MDAKPQRPLRALHIQGDENAPPFAQPTLHSRHKSTGTLSTMLGANGIKAAAKRTAFGDVSNTAKSVAVKDDSVLAAKAALNGGFVKPQNVHLANVGQKKVPALLRPAQRPLNAASLKNLLHNGAKSAVPSVAPTSVTTTATTTVSETQAEAQQPVRLLTVETKRSAIFKDASSADVQPLEQTTSEPQPLLSRSHKSLPQLRTTESIAPVIPTLPDITDVVEEESEDRHLAESIYQDAPEVPVEENKEVYESYLRMMSQVNEEEQAELEPEAPIEKRPAPIRTTSLPSEPEEYWEEEEDEIYDDQGYTTAHSYRSRGDNTTGGATAVLAPKITSKIKAELALAKEIVEASRTAEEIEDEFYDLTMAAEYGEEIFEYMRYLEERMLPDPHYMDKQSEIQWSMRSVLMDWLVQVHHRFSLLPETLFLCVNYIDRFLSYKVVSLGKLQLVGATAIFVAAKYEEINCPSVGEIVYMVDGGYTVDEILKAERFMLSMLQFELGFPGPMNFLRRVSKADDYDLETRTLAKYFLEVTIMDERFVGSPPSFLAAGAHCLARLMLRKGDWTTAHVHYSGYTYQLLKPLVTMMLECCENPQQHHSAIFEKYSDRRYKRVATFVQLEMQKGFRLPSSQPRVSLPSPDELSTPMSFETRDSYKRMVSIKG